MGESRHPTHVALYDSSYVILFDNGDWLSQGLTNNLTRKMKQSKSNIEFLTLGPDGQWFFRLHNGKVFYNVKDENLRDELKSSTVRPYKLWFNDDDGYVLQFDDLSLSWDNIPIDFHKKLNGRQKSLSKVKDIAFGVNDTWRVSFQDGTARQSSNLPSYINKHLKQTECLVLDPVDGENYFIFKDNGKPEWQVNGDFDDDINVSDEEDDDDDIVYMDPQSIRYTQKSISPHFSNGKTIEELRQELADGTTTVDEIPTIDVVQTRSGNLWSLNNRRLWCFRHAHNIDQIPVNIVDEKPSWFHNRIEKLENPFHIRIRGSSETGFHSDVDHDSDSDDYDY